MLAVWVATSVWPSSSGAESVVINEIMQNPSAVSDSNGEWFEVHNPTGSSTDINGWTIEDNDFDSHLIAHGGPLNVPAGGFVILARNGDAASNGGVSADYVYGSALALANSSDELVLVDSLMNEVDRVEWDDGATFPDPNGASMALADPSLDNNLGANWCASNIPFGAGDFGTPGAANDCPGAPPPEVVINEIMQNPSAVFDSNGEWFEVHNPTSSGIDINGWTIADNDFDSHLIANGGPLIAPAGGFLVLGNNADSGTNGGVGVDYEFSDVFLSNSSDELVLLDTSLAVVDRVEWDNGATFPDPNGASMALVDPSLDNNVGANWCESSTPFGDGDFGTPGTANDCLGPPVSGVVINEIHADPASGSAGDANGDGVRDFSDDEFVEIINTSGSNVDISGWTLSDGFSVRHTFPSGTIVEDQCGIVVFGGGTPTGSFGGCVVQTASSGALGLNNGGDTVTLNDGSSDVATASYGSEGGDNQSLTLDPDLTGTPPYVKHSVATGSGGALFSPGTLIDGSQFTGCPSIVVGPFEIYEIQGSGLVSPFVGQTVLTENNAVSAVAPDGFFMQTPTSRTDGDDDTSDGIFVFTGSAPTVAVGDKVDVTGTVAEFFGMTEFGFGSTVTIDGTVSVPDPVVFDETTPSPDPTTPSCATGAIDIDFQLECFEGMLVAIEEGAVTGPNQRFGPDPIAEVHITAAEERTFREEGIEFPGLPGLPEWDGNPEVFELDPDWMGLPNEIIPAGSSFDAVGVIGFEFGGYELFPTELDVDEADLPVEVRGREPGEFTVGSLNLFRLFDDDSDDDEQVVSAAEYQRRLDKFAQYIVEVIDSPDILAVQEAEKLGVLDDLAEAINDEDSAVNYMAHLVEGNDVGGIDVGFLVRQTIQVDAVTQLGKDEILTYDGSLLHDRPPLLLEGSCIAPYGLFPIKVMNVHIRSLGGIDDPTDGPRVRQKRYEQAESIAVKVDALQAANPDIGVVVIGDFNAFEFTDGYVDVVGQIKGDFEPDDNLVCDTNTCDDLVDPDLTDQVLDLDAEERYSFIFRGNAQALDHALTTEALDDFEQGIEYGRGNADAAFDLINDDSTPLRSSDHDGLVLFVQKDEDNDGVPDQIDVCTGTEIPESVPTKELGTNRWALGDGDGIFDTNPPEGNGPGDSFTIGDTAGCSCEQIIEALGLGKGHEKHGCSTGAMRNWVDLVNP